MAKKKIEFDALNPLIVSIEKHNGVWDIHASKSSAHDHHQVMKNRLKQDKLGDKIDTDYTSKRKLPGAPDHPPFVNNQDHPPIIMREGETVKFECIPAYAFLISADRDPNVTSIAEAPDNPFAWSGAKSVPPGSTLTATVILPPLDANENAMGPGPNEQGFYKFTATVYAEEGGKPEIVKVDPDGYCDR